MYIILQKFISPRRRVNSNSSLIDLHPPFFRGGAHLPSSWDPNPDLWDLIRLSKRIFQSFRYDWLNTFLYSVEKHRLRVFRFSFVAFPPPFWRETSFTPSFDVIYIINVEKILLRELTRPLGKGQKKICRCLYIFLFELSPKWARNYSYFELFRRFVDVWYLLKGW